MASRALMETLGRCGFAVEVLSGPVLELDAAADVAHWCAERGLPVLRHTVGALSVDARGLRVDTPAHSRVVVGDVPITLYRPPCAGPRDPDGLESGEFLSLFEATIARFEPDVLISYGGSALDRRMRALCRARGIVVLFPLHNFSYNDERNFIDVNEIIVPSSFAADYYREALGLRCTVLPNLIDPTRSRAETWDPKYLTFVNPSAEKGVYAFARIAAELGRLRPDIPLLVVEGRGDERTLAECGLDLRVYANVHLMSHTPDPRRFWGVTRICLLPSLWWENQPLVAVEALVNGIPVIGSDRGGIPETLGSSGVVLPLPDRLTMSTRIVPTAEEVAPWVEAVIRLWDDAEAYAAHRRLALAEAERWSPADLVPRCVSFFQGLGPDSSPMYAGPRRLGEAVVLVPWLGRTSAGCERGLLELEGAGVRVIRSVSSPDIDLTRNRLVAEALDAGAEGLLLIDSDLTFDARDAIRVLARPEPVIAGLYSDPGQSGFSSLFAEEVAEVHVGPDSFGLYPLKYAGGGFLRIRSDVLRRVMRTLGLPPCEAPGGRDLWPFFQPMVLPLAAGGHHYLTGDWAFSRRLEEIGVTPLADASLRLFREDPLDPESREFAWSRSADSWDQIPGMFDFAAAYDAAVAGARDGSTFVEVGCLVGRSTCYLGEKIRQSGKAITLYAVDTARGSASDTTGRVIAPSVGGSYAGILHRNVLRCGLEEFIVPILTESVRAARLFPPESVDFCFVDADHAYGSVIADLAAWWPKIRPGGTLAGHDYRQSAPWLLGVTPAVHDFFRIRDASHPLLPHCWAVTKPGR